MSVGPALETYTLTIEVPRRPVSTVVRAESDAHAVRKAAELLWATCATIGGLGDYRVRLTRADGSNVMVPLTVAFLAAKS